MCSLSKKVCGSVSETDLSAIQLTFHPGSLGRPRICVAAAAHSYTVDFSATIEREKKGGEIKQFRGSRKNKYTRKSSVWDQDTSIQDVGRPQTLFAWDHGNLRDLCER